MNITCPNKNLDSWKNLVKKLNNENLAYHIWDVLEGDFNTDGTPVDSKLQVYNKELDNHLNPTDNSLINVEDSNSESEGSESLVFDNPSAAQQQVIQHIENNPVNKNDKGYEVGGTSIKRVTELVKAFNLKTFGNPLKEEETVTSIKAMKGTVLHTYYEVLFNKLIKGGKIRSAKTSEMMAIYKETKAEVIALLKAQKDSNGEMPFAEKTDAYFDLLIPQKVYVDKFGREINNKVLKEGFEVGIESNMANNVGFFFHIATEVTKIYDQIQANQEALDPNFKPLILTEQVIYSAKDNLAGTIDVMVVYSDGSAAIYDWKNIFFKGKYNPKTGRHNITEAVKDYKEEGYNIQLGTYAQMLLNSYGVTRIKELRIIPANVQLRRDERKSDTDPTRNDDGFGWIELGITGENQDYLEQIPVISELTDDDKLNELLARLTKKRIRLTSLLKKNRKNNSTAEATLESLKKQIKALQLRKDLEYLYHDVIYKINDAKYLASLKPDSEFFNYDKLVDSIDLLKGYEALVEQTSSALNDTPDVEKKEYLNGLLKQIILEIDLTRRDLNNAVLLYLQDRFQRTDFLEAQKSLSTSKRLFSTISDYNEPIFDSFYEMVKEANTNHMLTMRTVEGDIKTKTIALESWAKANGMNLQEAFNKIIKKKTGNLITELSEEFFEEWEENITIIQEKPDKAIQQSVDWLKEHLEFDREALLERRKKYRDYLLENYPRATDNKLREKKLVEWDAKYNLITEDSAWAHPHNKKYRHLKPNQKAKDKYTSKEYTYMNQKENKPLLDYFNMYIEYNARFAELTKMDIQYNMIPHISKTLLDSFKESGFIGATKDSMLAFKQAIEVREGDEAYVIRDEDTGEVISKIPMPYLNPLTTPLTPKEKAEIVAKVKLAHKEGTIEYEEAINTEEYKATIQKGLKSKSTDLSSSLLLMANSAYLYREREQMESVAKGLRVILTNQKELLTDKLGQPINNYITKAFESVAGKPNKLEAFDSFVNYYVYGQKIQDNANLIIKSGDKYYDGRKLLANAMSYFSLKTLGFNAISAGAGLLGAKANAYFTGMEARYYDNKQMRVAEKAFVTRDKKYAAFSLYFEVIQESLLDNKVSALSSNSLKKRLTLDNFFYLQRQADNIVDNNVLVSMAQNYTMLPDGKIVRIVPADKGKVKSLWEMSSIDKDGKLLFNGKELSNKSFTSFRKKVMYVSSMIKGNTSGENINLIQTHLFGKLIMQFRNWIPRILESRFNGLGYKADLEEYEMGKYIAGFKAITDNQLVPAIKEFIYYLLEAASFGIFDGKYLGKKNLSLNEKLRHQINKMKVDNPKLNLTEEEYVELIKGKLRSLAGEVRAMLLIGIIYLVLTSDWDDDDEPLYKDNILLKNLIKLMERTANELAFTMNPLSVEDILKTPIPVVGLLSDTLKTLQNTIDEGRDLVMGERSGYIFDNKKSRDMQPLFYNTVKMIPGVGALYRFIMFDKWFSNVDKESRELQFGTAK